MIEVCARSSGIVRSGSAALGLVLAVAAGSGMGPAMAQGLRVGPVVPSLTVQIEAPVSSAETVRLLVGLGNIRADLQLGMLSEGGASASAHFRHPLAAIWPGLKEGLMAAGVADLGPVLQQLEAGGGKDAVRAAYLEAEAALLKARSTLNPTAEDQVVAVLELTTAAAGQINASGPTEVQAYQRAWALLMVARGELDLLARSADPAMAKLAVAEAMAIDEMIITMPDPNQTAPVPYDPTALQALVSRLQKMDEAV